MRKRAIVTMVVGDAYLRNFRKYCFQGWKTYADRHNLDLIIIDQRLDTSPRAMTRSVAWQKCLAVSDDAVKRYSQVAWIDADIMINPTSPNIFDSVPESAIGAVEDYAYPTYAKYRSRLDFLYARWRRTGIPFIENPTPHTFLQNWGLDPLDHVVQTGVLVVSPEFHRLIMQETYSNYEDKGSADWNYEMRPLSYEIVSRSDVFWLDQRFNLVVCFGVQDTELDLFLQAPSFNERLFRKLGLRVWPLVFSRNRKLSQIYRRLYGDVYFLHFAGRQQDIALLA